ncbi:DNA/RNA non-specific endonuclease [Antarctobacter jejuensis]|uniref:DNA/RNA non-specific endonuclease n=1 Tax=Antarctobacter jejuensis TaxID=1439938 RepID=UPI003FD03505
MPPSTYDQFTSLLEDSDLLEEIQNKAARGGLRHLATRGIGGLEAAERLADAAGTPRPAGLERMPRPGDMPRPSSAMEAIVLLEGRPSLLVQNGTFATPDSAIWDSTLSLSRSAIEAAIARTGRVDLFNNLDFDWVGTGWIVAPGILCTNRHVAVEFAQASGGGFTFRTNLLNEVMAAEIDFRVEHDSTDAFKVKVEEILYIAPDGTPDIALLKIATDAPLPEPLELDTTAPQRRAEIGTVGFPANDPRNGADALADIFKGIFGVKRFAPGKVSHTGDGEHWFVHDCSTLGGASGSAVFSLDTGKVVGLHFSGRFLSGNFAVKTAHVADALAGLSTTVPVGGPVEEEAIADGRHPPAHFDGREGYREDFLEHEVALPGFGTWDGDITDPGNARKTLDYHHFSVVMSSSRKLPLFTAVNIDGQQARRAFRSNDKWFIDDRIDEDLQLGNEIYFRNDLDRGHMVRRLDPVWGTVDDANMANEDTFHYVNAAPQHKNLNQRIWLQLENFLLDSAKAKDLRMSVFTGPVFRADDRLYRDLVRLPREYWKVAVLADVDGGQLLSAGYVLSQGEMIKNITEVPFVFGEHRTYQVRIEAIAEATGLNLSALAAHDVMTPGAEEITPARVRRIEEARDIRL